MYPAGFEPAHPKITELESVALDHSAKGTWCNVRVSIPLGLYNVPGVFANGTPSFADWITSHIKYSRWGSNPQSSA